MLMMLENITTWLETQDLERTYNYRYPSSCIFAIYLKEKEPNFDSIGPYMWRTKQGIFYRYPKYLEYIAHNPLTSKDINLNIDCVTLHKALGWTFGDALDRARQIVGNEDKNFGFSPGYGG